jgi:hypothetical protein
LSPAPCAYELNLYGDNTSLSQDPKRPAHLNRASARPAHHRYTTLGSSYPNQTYSTAGTEPLGSLCFFSSPNIFRFGKYVALNAENWPQKDVDIGIPVPVCWRVAQPWDSASQHFQSSVPSNDFPTHCSIMIIQRIEGHRVATDLITPRIVTGRRHIICLPLDTDQNQ